MSDQRNDIDGSEAERTFTFAVDGVAYEIDLSTENIKEFNTAIGGFVESARKVGKLTAPSARRAATGSQRTSREQTAAIREWARKDGRNVSDRGRIPLEVLKAFQDAHRNLAAVG
ncbi:MAG: Lsr2 family protein [Actinobacteria bacterium]|nr:Lsr2 family protein [Actinomycetota bacterium]